MALIKILLKLQSFSQWLQLALVQASKPFVIIRCNHTFQTSPPQRKCYTYTGCTHSQAACTKPRDASSLLIHWSPGEQKMHFLMPLCHVLHEASPTIRVLILPAVKNSLVSHVFPFTTPVERSTHIFCVYRRNNRNLNNLHGAPHSAKGQIWAFSPELIPFLEQKWWGKILSPAPCPHATLSQCLSTSNTVGQNDWLEAEESKEYSHHSLLWLFLGVPEQEEPWDQSISSVLEMNSSLVLLDFLLLNWGSCLHKSSRHQQ